MTAPTDAAPRRAGLYARASVDPKKRGRSVADQLTECRRTAAHLGWAIVAEYPDIDRSASRYAKRTREQFEKMKRDVENDTIDVIVSWEASRMFRDLEVYVALRNLCEANGVLWCYNGTVYDPSKRQDRMMLNFMAIQAEDEAEGIKERNTRTTKLNRERGGVHGKLPFGYTRSYDPKTGDLVGQFPHPDHADVVVDLFQRAARRESLLSLAKLLQAYRPSANTASVRVLLTNKTYLGLRKHRGETVKGTWEPLVGEALFWRVQEILGEPGRRTSRDQAAKHLLSGIAGCGVCAPGTPERAVGLGRGPMNPSIKSPTYRCRYGTHVAVACDRLDAYVEEAVIQWLRTPAAAAAFQAPDDGELTEARGRLEALRGQLAEARNLAGQFDPVTHQPRLSVGSLVALEEQVLPRIRQAEAEVQRLAASGDPVVDTLVAPGEVDVEGAWAELTVAQKRHALRRLVRVTLNRAQQRGTRRFEPGRVELLFAGQPGFVAKEERRRGEVV